MLPKLMFFAAMLGVSWFVFRWLRQEIARVDRQMARARRVLGHGRMPRLELDPVTGYYRLALKR